MSRKILRLRALCEKLDVAGSTVFDWLNVSSPRHDPTFPRQIALGNGRATGWIESEVEDWLTEQVEKSRTHAKEV